MESMILSPLPRDLRQEQRRALIEALKRHGYTCVDFDYDDYYEISHPTDLKPYDVIIDDEALVILHRDCTDCRRYIYPKYIEHKAEFLKAMIPVIGRLDAYAKLDLCEDHPGWSPRLWIRL